MSPPTAPSERWRRGVRAKMAARTKAAVETQRIGLRSLVGDFVWGAGVGVGWGAARGSALWVVREGEGGVLSVSGFVFAMVGCPDDSRSDESGQEVDVS